MSFVLVVLLRFDRRCALHSARGVCAGRWIRASLLCEPKLAGTDGLDVRKGEVLVVVQVVEDLVVRCAKGTVGGGFEGNQNDGPKYVVDSERAHLIKSSADITESSEKSFPYLLSAKKIRVGQKRHRRRRTRTIDTRRRYTCLPEDRVRVRTLSSMIVLWSLR